MSASNPFPGQISTDGYQTISSTCSETDQVRVVSGNFMKKVTIVKVSTVGLSLSFELTYNSQISTATASPVGNKWRHNYMRYMDLSQLLDNIVTYVDPTGRHYAFYGSDMSWSNTGYYLPATLTNPSGAYVLTFADGSKHVFDGTTGLIVESTDRNGNGTTYQYASGNLASVTEPTGRQILFGYTGDFLTSLTDPNGNGTTLVYDVTHSNLTEIMGPAGCLLQYGYTDPTNSLITSRTDPNGNVYSYTYVSSFWLATVTDAETPSNTLTYAYDTIDEYTGDNPIITLTFPRTTLTDALGNVWEYRFDQSGNLWRVIEPVDSTNSIYQWKRFYWDNNQQLLYHSTGHPLINNYSGTGDMAGPRDCTNNTFRRSTTDSTLAVPLQYADGNGQLTNATYNSARRPTAVGVWTSHLGVQGNWVGQYGTDGWVLCAFSSTASDELTLPSYVSSVDIGTATRERLDNSDWYDHLMDPRTLVFPTSLAKGNGYWQSDTTYTITVNMNTAWSFNLSIYVNATDQEYSTNNPLLYNEQMGNDVTVTVTDNTGTHTFEVTNSAMGNWATVPVTADATHPATITVSPAGANAGSDSPDVRISAVMFDPYDNRQTLVTYDTNNNPSTVTDGLGNTSSATYNADGTLRSQTDKNGHTTLFFYDDPHKNPTRVVDPYGNTTTRTYDLNGNLLSVTDANGHTTTYTYDGKNRLLTTTNPVGAITTRAYDSAGNLVSVTDAKGNETQSFYTADNRLYKVTDALSNDIQYAYDARGNLYTVTDPNTNVTTYAYDNAHRVIQTTRADGSIVQQAYDTQGNVMATTSPNGNQATIADINVTGAANFFRNPSAERFDQTNAGFAQSWGWLGYGGLDTGGGHTGPNSLLLQTSTTNYAQYFYQPGLPFPVGARGLASFWARPDGSADASSVQASAMVFQTDGSLTEIMSTVLSLPTGSTDWLQVSPYRVDVPGDSQYVFTPMPFFRAYGTSASNTPDVFLDDFVLNCLSTGMVYDNEGNLVSTQTPDGATTQRIYDRMGRLSKTVDALGNTASMTYDSLDRVIAVTDALGNVTQYTYDPVGNRTSVTDPNSNVTQYAYDDNNRLVQITYPDNSTELFGYDAVGNRTSYTNNRGQVMLMTYDAANRLVQKLYATDSTTVQYTYDLVGNLVCRIERNGDLCWYSYDATNRLTSVERNPAPGTFSSTGTWLQRHVYDAASNRTEFDQGTDATGGVYDTAVYGTGTYAVPPPFWTTPMGAYDDMNRLTAYDDAESNETTLSYDIESRVSGITYPNGSPAVESTLGYDVMSHYVAGNTTMGNTTVLSLQYGYDPNGNRIAASTGSDTWYYQVDADNRLIQEDRKPSATLLDRHSYTDSGRSDCAGSVHEQPTGGA